MTRGSNVSFGCPEVYNFSIPNMKIFHGLGKAETDFVQSTHLFCM